MKSNIANILIFIIITLTSCSELKDDSYIFSAGSQAFDECYGIAIDSKNNIIVSGVFSSRINFSQDTLVDYFVSNGGLDFFVAKYNSVGKLLWVKRFGGTDMDEVSNICLDEYDNIYITGYFNGSVDFMDNDPSKSSRSFLLKLNFNGDKVWARKLSGINFSEGTSVIARNGFVYWTSFYNGILSDSLKSLGMNDIACTKLNYDGDFITQQSFGFKGNDQSKDIYISPDDHIFITGFLSNVYDSISSASVIELDLKLNRIATTTLYDSIQSEAISIIVDNVHNKYVSGSFNTLKHDQDAFVVKLSSENTLKWEQTFCSDQKEWAKGLAFDNSNAIISTVVLNKNAKVSNLNENFVGRGNYDIFISRLSKDGKILQHKSFGNSGEEGINEIIVDKSDNLFYCGWFYKTLSINQNTVTSRGDGDVFFGKEKLNSLFE